MAERILFLAQVMLFGMLLEHQIVGQRSSRCSIGLQSAGRPPILLP
jgi:hypothetical protein